MILKKEGKKEMTEPFYVRDVVDALDTITGGRLPGNLSDLFSGQNPFVVIKPSSIPGKAIMEIPGLIYGDPDMEIRKMAITMTLSENHFELAGSMNIDAIIAHHPIADTANSGGVALKNYCDLYNIAIFELHEAFHGLHPGIPYLHGHTAFRVETAYGGIPGNIFFAGKALKEINNLGDIVKRINSLMGTETEHRLLSAERKCRGCPEIAETVAVTGAQILAGDSGSMVDTILHIFPHTGFTPKHLEQAAREHPGADTVLASISRVKNGHPLVAKARELGLNFVLGNCHAMEIYENGLPLAAALNNLLPGIEIYIFKERVTATPLGKFGSATIRDYARVMARNYLLPTKQPSSAGHQPEAMA